MSRRSGWALLALILLLGGAAAAPAGATSPPAGLSCGDTITRDTVLTRNLTCSGDGLVIGAPGVTLDLGGRVLRGDGTGTGITLAAECPTVRNGAVRGFETGIGSAPLAWSGLAGPRFGGACLSSGTLASRYERLAVIGNGRGIALGFDLGRQSFSGVVVADNVGAGVTMAFAGPVRFVGSAVTGNGADGVFAYRAHGSWERNVFAFNGGSGLRLMEGGRPPSDPTEVRANVFFGNGGSGASLDDVAGFQFLVAENLAARNGGYGIAAGPTFPPPIPPLVVDGGGNVARSNGTVEQCSAPLVCSSTGVPPAVRGLLGEVLGSR